MCRESKEPAAVFHTDGTAAEVPSTLKRPSTCSRFQAINRMHPGIGAPFSAKVRHRAVHSRRPPERGLRVGTETSRISSGLALRSWRKNTGEENNAIKRLRDTRSRIAATCPAAKLNGHKTSRLPNTTNISFEAIEGEGILLHLDELGIAASSGSACTTGSLEPSHVMRAMGIPYTFAHSSIRFSLSRYTTRQEIDAVIAAMPPIIAAVAVSVREEQGRMNDLFDRAA
jgi:cysteine desulfurase